MWTHRYSQCQNTVLHNAGVPTYLLVNGTNQTVFTELQLLSVQGEKLAQVPLHQVHSQPSLFNATSFMPPDEFFYLKVSTALCSNFLKNNGIPSIGNTYLFVDAFNSLFVFLRKGYIVLQPPQPIDITPTATAMSL